MSADEPPELPGLYDLLAGLPRVKVTPDNITQNMIDRWYRENVKHQKELRDLREKLKEMTRLRDNALRQVEHAEQSIDVDLEGDINDAIAAMNWEWPTTGDDSPPPELVQTILGTVRPVVAHAIKRAEQAEAKTDRIVAKASDHIGAVLRRVETAEKLAATCTCGTPGLDYEGPQADCAVHGAIRALDKLSGRLTAAFALLRLAHHIRMYGEYAPGGTENWGDWDREAEQFLREGP